MVAVFKTQAVDHWPQLLLTFGSVACCAGDSKGGSAGGHSTAHHQGPGRLPSAYSCHTLQELCKAQVDLSVLIVMALPCFTQHNVALVGCPKSGAMQHTALWLYTLYLTADAFMGPDVICAQCVTTMLHCWAPS